MKIGIVNDHRGYQLKKKIVENFKDYELIDLGSHTEESVDYTDYAFLLGEKVASQELDFGVALCGSGIGICIACNKVKGIRCAKVDNIKDIIETRKDNDSNIISFNENTELEAAINYIKTFVETEFSKEERHIRRVNKIKGYEANHEC